MIDEGNLSKELVSYFGNTLCWKRGEVEDLKGTELNPPFSTELWNIS